MTHVCYPLVGGRVMRVTRLDACGRPQWGDCAQVVSEGFTSISATANIDDGEEIAVVNANGKRCVSQPAKPTITSVGVEIAFCDVDPELYALVTGQSTVYDQNGDAVGFRMNTGISPGDVGWALEVWSNVPGVECSEEDEEGVASAGTYGYLLYPFLQGGVLGDYTIENAALSFTVQGAVTKSGGQWRNGPYNVVRGPGNAPSGLLQPILSDDHFHVQLTEIAPPEPHCGCLPLDNPNWAPATTANAGAPGTWSGGTAGTNFRRPQTLAELRDSEIEANPTSAWTAGQFVILGDGSEAYWDGDSWEAGAVPAAGSEGPPTPPEPQPESTTAAIAGTPGAFNGEAPADLTELQASEIVPDPETAWEAGWYVVLGDNSQAYWDGSTFQEGTAPTS